MKLEEIKKKYKGIDIPEEIREDEAHLTHVALIKSIPNVQTMEFDNSAQIVKLNEQALETTKDNFARYAGGVVFVIHDGQQYVEEQKNKLSSQSFANIEDEKQKEQEEKEEKEKADKEAADKKRADEEKDALIKEQADKIAKYEAKEKADQEAKEKADKEAEAKNNTEAKKSGKA